MIDLTVKDKQKSRAWFTFFAALIVAVLIFLPFIIRDRGLFLYYGDYNVQEIPFYQHAHRMIREGNFHFDFYTDLGANFVGSYSFYMLGSPFFWAMLPFPNAWVPYLMGPMFILKFACMAGIAYHYIKRFVQNTCLVSLGSILYAFCGFHIYNVFFNHFVDVGVFFPLLLIGLEKCVVDRRYGTFAIAVAINAAINYFFFVGEVTFLIIYFVCRLFSRDFRVGVRTFLHLAFESVLGVMGGALLLPGLLALSGNGRVDNFLQGIDILLYPGVYRYGELINALFFMPELPARINFFPDEYAKWSSLSLWLPLFGAVGVLAFYQNTGKNFIRRVLTTCAVFALVPVLNSAFYAFNDSYYARWFYMPLLLMAVATVKVFELPGVSWKKPLLIAASVTAFFALFGILPRRGDNGIAFGVGADNSRLLLWIIFAILCLGITAALIRYALPRGVFEKCAMIAVCSVCVMYSIVYLSYGKTFSYGQDYMIDTALKDSRQVAMQDELSFYRSDYYGAMDNLGMFWGTKTTQCFHTVVPSSIMDFYDMLGLPRDVRSSPTMEHYALNSLLSVKYLYEDRTYGDAPTLYDPHGYVQVKETEDFVVWENTNYLPLGFSYTHYITRSQLQQLDLTERSHAMLHALVVEEKDIPDLSGVLSPIEDVETLPLSPADLAQTVQQRRAVTCSDAAETRDGLTASVVCEDDSLLFFSIPYDAGFTAFVDGKETNIYRANVGFMAISVPAGSHEIEFVYRAPGLRVGLWCFGAFAAVWPVYAWLANRKREDQR